ncbi:hypothetical protein B0T24DRAFT_673159 [Lasiosphaeria ovina]|uniref:DUF8004 domain-containing protein n=1 Tax=Lasiosphaeria ovina TaxID=92902 RepID=A0AAE0NKT4_9PEZI|nr:hypothetical protein B0T24DRAFT_673159 [Lasiosphaeria ovina]
MSMPPTTLKKTQKTPLPLMPPAVAAMQAPAPSEGMAQDRARSFSGAPAPNNAAPHPHRLQPRHPSPTPAPRGRSSSAQPPTNRNTSAEAPRVVSGPVDLRSQSNNSSDGDKRKSRKGWLTGGRSRSNSADLGKDKGMRAWIMSPDTLSDYNVAALMNGEKIPELWNEAGNVYIYLYPKGSGRGPSFKVQDQVFNSSKVLNEILESGTIAADSSGSTYLGVDDAARRTHSQPISTRRPGEGNIYLPLEKQDLDSLVAARNLFAFLTNQPLVGTDANPTIFTAFFHISGLLRKYGFSNYNGSSFGDSVDATFDIFLDQFGTADVRHSREKTLEALVMSEHMKSWTLYNEAFAHAVGKYDSLLELRSPLFNSISVSTRNRLERAHLNLVNRQANIDIRLESFEFPSLFAGIASSTSTDEYKNVKFKEWRNSFVKMRSFVLGYYKDLFGNWPPKARSKKNHFSQPGLNRQCLKMLYSDLAALYDLLVDRESITPRAIDKVFEDTQANAVDPNISALRKILSEFDHSSPPVLPPIPFDVPKIPSMKTIHENYNDLSGKTQAKFDKSLKYNELLLLLIKSRNIDTDSLRIPFLNAFKEFELKEAKSAHAHDLADQRIGYWLFLYVVIQSLPMLVVDAPGLNWTEGVEYFLCEAPQGNPSWVEDAGEVRKMWYKTDQGIVELSTDVILFSAEGVYMRSHCWLAAKAWGGSGGGVMPPPQASGASPLEPPRAVFQDMDPVSNPVAGGPPSAPGSAAGSPRLRASRNASPSGIRAGHAYRSSIAIGLEPLPGPFSDGSSFGDGTHGRRDSAGPLYQQGQQGSNSALDLSIRPATFSEQAGPHRGSHQGLTHTSTGSVGGSTFEDILKGMDSGKDKKKKSFF